MADREVDWERYLAGFHADRTGVVEDVLSRFAALRPLALPLVGTGRLGRRRPGRRPRVGLRPGGVLAAIAPAVRPLAPADVRQLGQLHARLRSKPRFPGPVELTGSKRTLLEHGMQVVEDKRERYRFTVTTSDDAWLLVSALYLPLTPQARVAAAVDHLTEAAVRRGSVKIAIPVRRLVAIK